MGPKPEGGSPQLAEVDIRPNTPRALADIRFNSLLAGDHGSSSDDELVEAHDLQGEDAHRTIEVSIGEKQTHLSSPKTPAVEKQAAMERAGGFFVSLDGDVDVEEPDGADAGTEPTTQKRTGAFFAQSSGGRTPALLSESPLSSPGRTPVPPASPWPPEQPPTSREGRPRSGLLSGLTRRRAQTGPEPEGWHQSILATLPSLPKNFSFGLPFSHGNEADHSQRPETEKSSRTHSRSLSKRASESESTLSTRMDVVPRARSSSNESESYRRPSRGEEVENANAGLGGSPSAPQSLTRTHTRPGLLHRSTSDGSLVTTRTLSIVSSLGDDSRFEDVHEQVNSRLKAIKDTWHDSNLKLPSMPKHLSVASLTPDFIRERSGSLTTRKQSSREPSADTRLSSEDHTRKSDRPEDPITRQPYRSAKAAVTDANVGKHANHPHLNQALEQLEGDVVVLGGYRGSILRSAEPPHRQLWVPVKVGLNLRKVNLEVGFEEGDDERATESVIPGGMLTHIGPVDVSRRLFKKLRSCENARTGKLRVHDYGYDWRLHPIHLSKRLVSFMENLPCNQPGISKNKRGAVVIAHSLGGLITRHAVNQRPELFKGVVYAGVPKTCVNILGPLRNGDEVMLSSRVLTAQVNFSIRTSFALLPLDGRCFIDKNTKEEYPVDFFDPQTWVEHRLSPCIARALPPLCPQEKTSTLTGYVNSVANALPGLTLPGRKGSVCTHPKDALDTSKVTSAAGAAEPDTPEPGKGMADHVGSNEAASSPRTAVTVPRDQALAYLHRTLASVKRFKQSLAFDPVHSANNLYPPIAVIYGKSTPTVYGAKVDGRESIKRADAYDELAFASGDGVVLARAAMVPKGYKTTAGGVVSSERGHVTLLADLEAVGKCLNAVIEGRTTGVGLGPE